MSDPPLERSGKNRARLNLLHHYCLVWCWTIVNRLLSTNASLFSSHCLRAARTDESTRRALSSHRPYARVPPALSPQCTPMHTVPRAHWADTHTQHTNKPSWQLLTSTPSASTRNARACQCNLHDYLKFTLQLVARGAQKSNRQPGIKTLKLLPARGQAVRTHQLGAAWRRARCAAQ